jgi:enolase-phosphatase E1
MIKAILLDIEGTTTPIDFVHKKLFPFAEARFYDFVRENFEALTSEIAGIETEYHLYEAEGQNIKFDSPKSVAGHLIHLSRIDRKSTPLKSIQGKIWQAGYESGALKSEIFDDVPPAFERWKSAGKTIAIYSSGSVLAQKLLFRYTDHGDLTTFISNYFDTNAGGKKHTESYRKIASEMQISPNEILFVSDVLGELNAASAAGYQTALSIRKGNAQVEAENEHRPIRSFDELSL